MNASNDWPVDMCALNGASMGSLAWRWQGQIYLTIVLKASFMFEADRPMKLVAPDAICVDEQPNPKGRGLVSGGDMAPFMSEAEFLMVGHAREVNPSADGSMEAHVGLVRERELIYEKRLPLTRDLWVDEARGFFLGGWGPISRHWPARARLLAQGQALAFTGPCLELPDACDLAYFQASPYDQRLPPLRGDEWLLFEHIFPDTHCLRTQLPTAMGIAKVFGEGGSLSRGHPLPMVLDSLLVDVDRRLASLLWRGYFPLSSLDVLSSLRVKGGIIMPGQSLDWEKAPEAAAPPHRPAESPQGLESTIFFGDTDAGRLSARRVTPFERLEALEPTPVLSSPVPGEALLLAGTMAMPDDFFARMAQFAVTPFVGHSSRERPEGPRTSSLSALPFVALEAPTPVLSERERGNEYDEYAEPEAYQAPLAMVAEPPILELLSPPAPELGTVGEKMSIGQLFLVLMAEAG